MKILLTGGSGQVGTECLARMGQWQVLAPSRAEMDLASPDSIRAWLERQPPDLVLSVGAYTAVDRAEDEPERAMAANRDGPAALAAYCARTGTPILHLSTDYVFDGSAAQAYSPEDAIAPLGVYGRSKAEGEAAIRQAPRHLILRVSWVFSAHGSNFLKTMLRLGATREVLGVVDDQCGGPTWAGHIAEALVQLCTQWQQRGELPWGTYHYAGSPTVSWCGFAREILSRASARGMIASMPTVKPIRTEDYPTRARRPARSAFDCTQTESHLGLAQPDWRAGVDASLLALKAATSA